MQHLGNFAAGQTVFVPFATNDAAGAAIAPSTPGTISIYKDNGTTKSTAGVTYTPSFDGQVGINLVKIVTSDAFYAAGHDYTVVLNGAVIDGETVNTVLAAFSIDNRIPANNIDGKTLQQALQIMAAILAGKVSGAGSGQETFKGLDGATDRVQVTTDAAGNRSAVIYE